MSRRFQRGSDRVNLHRPTLAAGVFSPRLKCGRDRSAKPSGGRLPLSKGLHLSTFPLNVSTFSGIVGVQGVGRLRAVEGVC